MIAKVAPANSRVLVSGPPGSGKELVARLIHSASARTKQEFVAVSAAGMAPERLDVELFGEEGEGGRPRKIGVFERAHNGTLYLDEVADMPRETQSRILRVLVEQRFPPGRRRQRRPGRCAGDLLDLARPARRDRRGTVPRGPVPPPERGAGARAGPVRASRGHPGTDQLLHRSDRRGHGSAAPSPGRRRPRHPAGPDLARQRPPAAQQRRAHADPGQRASRAI
jgi:hypothetical protein